MYEGCGSVAHAQIFAPVKRSEKVAVQSYDLNGEKFTVKYDGLAARVALHEIGHLNGETFVQHVVDHRSFMDREEYLAQ